MFATIICKGLCWHFVLALVYFKISGLQQSCVNDAITESNLTFCKEISADPFEDDDEDEDDHDFSVLEGLVTQFTIEIPLEIESNITKQKVSFEPGEMGHPHIIDRPTDKENELIQAGFKRHAFNEYISDQISLHRSLPDYRNHWCRKPGLYNLKDLLPASIVMCFHNEALSVLLRSVHSILDKTPVHLLKEIILIDDNSSFENLWEDLEEHIHLYHKVKLIRSKKRLGLIKARMMGAANAQGPILVFLDSHVEVTEGWFEPMSHRITENNTNVVCPIIDVIDDKTLEFKLSERSVTAVGGFTWDMMFSWKSATDDVLRSLRTPADPVPSPTMAGGLFAIHKDFFYKLGQYDEEYEIWGAENLEISFKVWMCGGRLEIVPCSHIGHLYRNRAPYTRNGTESRPHRNYIRLATVWLDDYAQYYYQKIGNNLGDYGDISSRLELKNKLKCKSFEWYIHHVYPDLFNPKSVAAQGEIRNEAFGGNYCLDGHYVRLDDNAKTKLTVWPCHNQGGNQYWYLTKIGELRQDDNCLDFDGGGFSPIFHPCHGQLGNQLWILDDENGFIVHVPTKSCLSLETRDEISVIPCEGRITQRWKMADVNISRVAKVLKFGWQWRSEQKR